MTTELILPEYGRNIQNMVEIAKNITERTERNRCARTIIDCMGNLFPYLRDNEAFRHKLWDHLALMANFDLDIDYPFEINTRQKNSTKPEPIPYDCSSITDRHYGRFISQFIHRFADDPQLAHRQELIIMTANYMKRCYNMYNQNNVDDATIFNDLYRLSDHKIDLRHSGITLQDMSNERRKNNDNKNKKSRH